MDRLEIVIKDDEPKKVVNDMSNTILFENEGDSSTSDGDE